MGRAQLRLEVPVPAPPEAVWAAATDWPRQGEWMLGTSVHVVRGDGGPGSQLAAFTGFYGLGFLDTMEIVEMREPLCCRVRHTGRLISGEGGFRVISRGDDDRSTFVWWEDLSLPAGTGPAWPVVRPAFAWGLRKSLDRFAVFCVEHRRDG
ncbi:MULTISPECIES: SRPBCC family protein [unclassified Saccharopolyspora]|uniref:SRPBCC family protein n=1 Tax=Saccharopolyspora TaxID=1835 RepID=UPI0025E1AC78|nr:MULTISPECIES: SRPBCC family protein [unclassified Saccharopolyspora]